MLNVWVLEDALEILKGDLLWAFLQLLLDDISIKIISNIKEGILKFFFAEIAFLPYVQTLESLPQHLIRRTLDIHNVYDYSLYCGYLGIDK